MKTLIVYKSKYGSTEQYARWLHESIQNSVIVDLKNPITVNIEEFDNVVIGSYVYMGKIQALGYLTKNWEQLETKNLYLFTVGMAPKDSPESKLTYEPIPAYIRKKIKYLKIQGIINNNKLNFLDRLIIKFMEKAKPELGQQSTKLDRNNLEPIITYFKSLK